MFGLQVGVSSGEKVKVVEGSEVVVASYGAFDGEVVGGAYYVVGKESRGRCVGVAAGNIVSQDSR